MSLSVNLPVTTRSPLSLWLAARHESETSPLYDDVVLGNLGRAATNVALVRVHSAGEFAFGWSGENFSSWLGLDPRDLTFDDLPNSDAVIFTRACSDAIMTRQPVSAQRHIVRDGIVEAREYVAYPLRNRSGHNVILLHASEEVDQTDLVKEIFRSNNQCFIVLSAVCNEYSNSFDFYIIALNEAASALTSRPAADLMWRNLSDAIPYIYNTDMPHQLRDVLHTGKRRVFEISIPQHTTGQMTFLRVEAGSIGHILAVTLTDIGQVREREIFYRLLFESNPMPMLLCDLETCRFIDINGAAVHHYGYSREDLLGMILPDLSFGELEELMPSTLSSHDPGFDTERLCRHRKADGTPIEVSIYTRQIRYGGRSAVLLAILDVTERRHAEARIAYLAHHDALTALPNRILFVSSLTKAMRLAERDTEGSRNGVCQPDLAVLCIDLDGFKLVNDTFGHGAGDDLLMAVAERLRGCVRAGGEVARFGGDEFALFQHDLGSTEAACALAQRIVDTLSAPYAVDGRELVIGASVGVALKLDETDTADSLLHRADMALYRAKAEGKRTFRFFESGMAVYLRTRRQLEEDLRAAFQAEQLELHYQPLLDAGTGKVISCEALLRWNHPSRGAVAPAEFVPLAEEIGLIGPIGDWVLRQACAEAAHWPAEIRVSVNLSPAQFRIQRNLIQSVLSALDSSGLAPSRLELEITESVLLADNESNLAILRQLRKLGVRIAMDDFGTGYSSLSYLRTFPFDKIKIDRSFVRDLGTDPHASAIIEAVTRLATRLSIRTTAEGVETEDQAAILRAEGCDELQGFLFSRPLSSDAVRMFIGFHCERGRDLEVASPTHSSEIPASFF